MENPKEKLSIVMSVYNQEKFLSKSIESILNQSYTNFEFIIYNDGSNDNSEKIINYYLKKDNRISYYKHDNIGLTKTLNKAISKSTTDYIVRQDADDLSNKNRILKQMNEFKKNDKLILCGSNGIIIDDNDKIINKTNLPTSNFKIKKKMYSQNCIIHSSVIFKKKYFSKVKGYDENYKFGQDYNLWCKMSSQGEYKNLKEYLIYCRNHANNISNRHRNDQTKYEISTILQYHKANKKNTKHLEKILFFINQFKLEKKYAIQFSELNFFQKLLLFLYPKKIIKLILFNIFKK